MTPVENFRFGFLLRCAEEGCDMQEVTARVKLAHAIKEGGDGLVGTTLGTATSLAKAIGMLPLWLTGAGLATAGLVGPAAGYALAHSQEIDADPEETKKQELIAAYRAHAARLQQRAKQRAYRPTKPSLPSF